jgi:ribosomal protein S12 methylthiotransferase
MKIRNKIGVITLGCSKNTVDSERLMRQLKINRFKIVPDPNNADIVIINTCGFIKDAKEESIDTIINAIGLKNAGIIDSVIVTGCLSSRYKEELEKELPEVDAFFGPEDYSGILKSLGGNLRHDLLGERELIAPSHSAYMKISEGCNNPCSFCAIPIMRGKYVSRPFDSLVHEAAFLASKGVKELNIIAQDTTDYGRDISGASGLAPLLDALSKTDGVEWLRLLYTYPSRFPLEVLDMIENNSKICRYIDMPLQHISDTVLKSMRRGITSQRTRELIDTIRTKIPKIALRTTMIVGYPAETDKDFDELYNFVKEYKFDRLGVFAYSPEEGTFGYSLGDTVPDEVKAERMEAIMELQKEISLEKNRQKSGTTLKVMIDRLEGTNPGGFFIARSEYDAPEVDGEILIKAEGQELKEGQFCEVLINNYNEYDLYGELKN